LTDCEMCALSNESTPATERRFAHTAFGSTECREVALCADCASEGWYPITDAECILCGPMDYQPTDCPVGPAD
jgi:hypothetical protein